MAEITQCPECRRKLNVQEDQLGQTAQCPVCGAFFTAAVMAAPRPPARPPAQPQEREPRPRYEEERRPRYDEDDDRRPRRRYPDPYSDPLPHRGGVVLALGLVGLLLSCVPVAGWVLGGIALSMANTDLPRMDRGVMDREGRGLTVGGQVCAIIAVIVNSILALVVCSGIANNM